MSTQPKVPACIAEALHEEYGFELFADQGWQRGAQAAWDALLSAGTLMPGSDDQPTEWINKPHLAIVVDLDRLPLREGGA